MDNNLIWLFIGLVVVVVVGLIVFMSRKDKALGFNAIRQDSLTMKEVVEFFQNSEVMNELESNPDLLAVAMRNKMNDGNIRVILTLFNSKEKKIITTPNTKAYIVKTLDSDLEQSFGDKEMLVLE